MAKSLAATGLRKWDGHRAVGVCDCDWRNWVPLGSIRKVDGRRRAVSGDALDGNLVGRSILVLLWPTSTPSLPLPIALLSMRGPITDVCVKFGGFISAEGYRIHYSSPMYAV